MYVLARMAAPAVAAALLLQGCAAYTKPVRPDEKPTGKEAYLYGRFKIETRKSFLGMDGYQTMGFSFNCGGEFPTIIRFSVDEPVQVIKLPPTTCSLTEIVFTNADGVIRARNPARPGMMKDIVLEAGKAYYLGDFWAHSKTVPAGYNRIETTWEIQKVKHDYAATTELMKSIHPFLAGVETHDTMGSPEMDLSQPAAPADAMLVRQPGFTICETEGFIALGNARGAILFKESREKLLAASNDEFHVKVVNDLFGRIQSENLKNYGEFAASHFYACSDRENLPVERNLLVASVCLTRQDLVFYLMGAKADGKPQEQAVAQAKEVFEKANETVYPGALIERLAPLAYRVDSDNDSFELRRFAFETCLFPKEWKAWWDSTHPAKAE